MSSGESKSVLVHQNALSRIYGDTYPGYLGWVLDVWIEVVLLQNELINKQTGIIISLPLLLHLPS